MACFLIVSNQVSLEQKSLSEMSLLQDISLLSLQSQLFITQNR